MPSHWARFKDGKEIGYLGVRKVWSVFSGSPGVVGRKTPIYTDNEHKGRALIW